MPQLTDALTLGARGWSVVPLHRVTGGRCSCGDTNCPSPGEHPRIGREGPTTRAAGPAQLARWWARWPGANLGVVTGWVSALVVLEVDTHEGGGDSLADLERRFERLPETVTSSTGGGGRHLYFAHPTHLLGSRRIADGLDLHGEGALVVAPPSTHVSGAVYAWIPGHRPEDRQLGALPGWLDRPPATHQDVIELSRSPMSNLAADVLVDVVGESRHQEELLALTGGRRTASGAHRRTLARLVPQPENPADPDAIAVLIDGVEVGHLPRDLARRYGRLVAEVTEAEGEAICEAEIRGGWQRPHGDVGMFGVVLSLPRT